MAETSAATLMAVLRQAKLLDPEQLAFLDAQSHSEFADARSLAKELVRRGWLTAYQVQQLARGKARDLRVGPYLLLDLLGEGGMGQVFRARHQSLGRVVALKVIRKDRLNNPDAVRRFRREVQAAGQLAHPNVVLAYSADEFDGVHVLAMEYVEGVDLGKLVKQSGPLPIAHACHYVHQAACGLQHAFERGLVHRDIKPANLLVSQKDGIVKILDMGLARLRDAVDSDLSAITQDGKVIGTPDYIAPEQARNASQADIRADLYSLGCTLYYLLTGTTPFPGGGSIMERLLRRQTDDPVPIEQVRPDVPPPVRAVLAKLLARQPEDRYQTPAELAAALEPLTRDCEIGSRFATFDLPTTAAASSTVQLDTSPSANPHPVRPRTRRWLTAGILTVLMALVVPAFLLLRQGSGSTPASADARSDKNHATDKMATRDPHKTDANSSKDRLSASGDIRTLDAAAIPDRLRYPDQPRELVGILGDPFGRAFDFRNTSLVVSPNGKLIAVSGSPNNDPCARIWDLTTKRCLGRVSLPRSLISSPRLSFAFAGDDKLVVVVGSNVQVHTILDDFRGTKLSRNLVGDQQGYQIFLSPDGKHFVTSAAVDVFTCSLALSDLEGSKIDLGTGWLQDLPFCGFSDDGKWFITFRRQGPALPPTTARRVRASAKNQDAVDFDLGPVLPRLNDPKKWFAAVSPDGNTLAIASSEGLQSTIHLLHAGQQGAKELVKTERKDPGHRVPSGWRSPRVSGRRRREQAKQALRDDRPGIGWENPFANAGMLRQ